MNEEEKPDSDFIGGEDDDDMMCERACEGGGGGVGGSGKKMTILKSPWPHIFLLFTSVGATRGQGIIRVVATFFWHSHCLDEFKVNKAQVLTF